jgi:hypothetical protein
VLLQGENPYSKENYYMGKERGGRGKAKDRAGS